MANQPTWVTSRGSNSSVITYPASAALADIIDTTETWLLAHGWTLWDAAAGTNARAYRALHPDGISYGYMLLDYNTASHMFCKVYESWNATTHAGTNLCYSSDTADYAQHIDTINGGSMYIYATNAWAYFQSNTLVEGIGSTIGRSGCGYFAVARDNPEDTPAVGYPAWGWHNLNKTMVDIAYTFSFPRTRDNSTGGSAANNTLTTKIGSNVYNNVALWQTMKSAVNIWNSKNWAMTVSVGKMTGSFPEMKGRIYGLKLTTLNQGTGFNSDMDIKVDANKFYDPTGTLTEHWIMTEASVNGRMALPK